MNIGLKRLGSVYCFASIEALYLNASTVDRISAELSNAIEECLATEDQGFSSVFVRLHNLLIAQGNTEANESIYGNRAFDWYRAGVNLLILAIKNRSIHYWQMGTIHCAIAQKQRLELLPVHNVSQEIKSGTLQESSLAALWNRDSAFIASYLMPNEPVLARSLAQLSSEKFWEKIGHIPTRKLGYLKDPERVGESKYLSFDAAPSSGTVALVTDSAEVIVYFPGVRMIAPHLEQKLISMMSKAQSMPGEMIQFLSTEKLDADDAVKLEVSCFKNCLVTKETKQNLALSTIA